MALLVFISYAREDARWCERIEDQLRALKPHLLREIWYDREIPLGADWKRNISNKLNQADIILLVLSESYFGSEFCAKEADRALERAKEKTNTAAVIPVVAEPVALEYSGYSGLNGFPPADKPLSKWHDPAEALAELTRRIGGIATARTGNDQSRMPHPKQQDLQELLQHLCNRTRQCELVKQALIRHRNKAGRPFVVVLQGHWKDAYQYFVQRLEHTILPAYLRIDANATQQQKPGRLTPLTWPEYQTNKEPFDLFGPRFAECVPEAEFCGTAEEINEKLKLCNVASVVKTTVKAGSWPNGGHELFDAYLEFWEEWPKLPENRMLIPVLQIEYGDEPQMNGAIATRLNGADFDSRPGLGGVALPPLPPIQRKDVAEWIEHRRVRDLLNCTPEQAIGRLDTIFKEQDQSFPLKLLADDYFPTYLECL